MSEQKRSQQVLQIGVLQLPKYYVAGASCGTIASLMCQPFDVLKTKMIGKHNLRGTYAGASAMSIIRNVFQTEGLTGLWRGYIPTFWRTFPGSAIYFGTMNTISSMLLNTDRKKKAKKTQLSSLERAFVGGISRGSAAIFTK